MAWRSELNYAFDGTADSAWDEDPHVWAVLKKVTASGRAPGSIVTRTGPSSDESAVVVAVSTPDFAETSEKATGKSWLEQVPLGAVPHLFGARHSRQEDLGASSVAAGASGGPEMKRKGGLSALAECAGAGSAKKAQRQAGAGLGRGVPVAGEELGSGGSADMPALEDAVAAPTAINSNLVSHQAGNPEDCRRPPCPPILDVRGAGSFHQDGLSEAPPLLLADLPPALLLEVLSHLRAHDLSVVACVSRFFRGLAAESQGWKNFYCERWHPARPLQGPPAEGAGESQASTALS